MRSVVILGSTGSIGTQALEVIRARRGQFMVEGLAGSGTHAELLAQQAYEFAVPTVAIADPKTVTRFWEAFEQCCLDDGLIDEEMPNPQVIIGDDAATQIAKLNVDIVLNAINGAAGLLATMACLQQGTTLALANKESLVIGGRLVIEAARPGQIVAVDSEHSAIAQALRAGRREEIKKIMLTASGGPFRGKTTAELAHVTAEQALNHPTWQMGRVITINSATLVNKGLEVIEAALLYDIDIDDIEVVVHPQSMVHSGVEFVDGALIVQASPPDMKLPIGLALAWPDRMTELTNGSDWSTAQSWTFEPLDNQTFKAVDLAKKAGRAAGTAPAVYNATNEICVDAFCEQKISFLAITETIAKVLDEHLANGHIADDKVTLDDVLAADNWARKRAVELLA